MTYGRMPLFPPGFSLRLRSTQLRLYAARLLPDRALSESGMSGGKRGCGAVPGRMRQFEHLRAPLPKPVPAVR